MTWSDTIAFMLLSREHCAGLTSKTIIDARSSVEALLCLSRDSRAEVDAMVEAARAAGGKADPCPPLLTREHLLYPGLHVVVVGDVDRQMGSNGAPPGVACG